MFHQSMSLVLLTLSLVRQESRSSFLDLRVREGLVGHTLFEYGPRKRWLDRFPESKRGGSAKQSTDDVKELHLETDRMKAAAK